MAVFGYFSKIKKGSETSFWNTFFAWFFHKNVPYLIHYQWITCQCHTFFPLKISRQFIFRQLMTSWVLRFMLDQALKQWLTEKKREEFECLENKKSFWNEIKNIFHSFWRAVMWWKIKICWKIADTSFKVSALAVFPFDKFECSFNKLLMNNVKYLLLSETKISKPKV